MSEGSANRPPSPIPTIAEIVTQMKRGVKFEVGPESYRWDEAQDMILVEGIEPYTLSEGQLFQVVATHPEAFGGRPATLAEVIERMKLGDTIQYGGGRSFEIFGWDAATQQLYVDSVDDGYDTRSTCSESRLAAALAESPQVFADVRHK